MIIERKKMVHIILSQSHDDFSRLVLCVIFTGILTWIFGYASLSLIEYYCNNHRCHFITDILKDLALPIVGTIVSVGLCFWSIYSIAAQIVESDNVARSTDRIAYYDLKKDGAVIRAEKKSDAPSWLVDEVETKIVSENKTSYQVQFKDEFVRIQKKNVK